MTATDNLGKVSHFRYDSRGNATSITDALGNAYSVTYNDANQPLIVTLPATGQTGAGNGTISKTYLYTGGPVT